MTIRKLNYTSRKRIGHEFITIRIIDEGTPNYRFDANLKLETLNFPRDSQVILEAYYQTERKRFLFGEIGNLTQPQDCSLLEFLSFSGINFRLIVVSPESGRMKIIGAADRIEPIKSGDKPGGSNQIPILPVEVDSVMNEAWKLGFKDDGPILFLNGRINKIKKRLVNDSIFALLIFPQILREIIYRMIFVDGVQIDDEDCPYKNWIAFLERYAGPATDWPEIDMKNKNDFDSDSVCNWADDVVENFSRENTFLDKLILREEENQK